MTVDSNVVPIGAPINEGEIQLNVIRDLEDERAILMEVIAKLTLERVMGQRPWARRVEGEEAVA
jgi:hypothetical protein